MTEQESDTAKRWAPWWMYVVPILGVNYARQAVLPYGTVPQIVDVMLALAIAAIMFVGLTIAYRKLRH